MKNIYKIILGLILILNFNQTNSQEATNDTIVPTIAAMTNNARLSLSPFMFILLNIFNSNPKLLHKILKMSLKINN